MAELECYFELRFPDSEQITKSTDVGIQHSDTLRTHGEACNLRMAAPPVTLPFTTSYKNRIAVGTFFTGVSRVFVTVTFT